jgi:hypothetical protein
MSKTLSSWKRTFTRSTSLTLSPLYRFADALAVVVDVDVVVDDDEIDVEDGVAVGVRVAIENDTGVEDDIAAAVVVGIGIVDVGVNAEVDFYVSLKKFLGFQGMTSILIGEDGNPIYHKRNWRSYAIYRLEHWGLRYVNNAEVTDDDIFEANQVKKSRGRILVKLETS